MADRSEGSLASRIHIHKFRGLCTAQINVVLFSMPHQITGPLLQLLLLVGGSCLPQDSRCTEETGQETKEKKVADITWKKVSEGVEVQIPNSSTLTLDGREWSGSSL
jgi:hypothetical protein